MSIASPVGAHPAVPGVSGTPNTHPHAGQPVLATGTPLAQAHGAVLCLHGRGSNAEDILGLAAEVGHPGLAYLAPQAAHNVWYPQRFLAPLAANEPWLSSALRIVDALRLQVEAAGIPAERIALLGFSQGACLALEYAARHARRYGAVIGLSGALIGPPDAPRDYPGTLAATPVFLGCSDVDMHIPKERVEASLEILRTLGGAVTMRLYAQMAHTVNDDEIRFTQTCLQRLKPAS